MMGIPQRDIVIINHVYGDAEPNKGAALNRPPRFAFYVLFFFHVSFALNDHLRGGQ